MRDSLYNEADERRGAALDYYDDFDERGDEPRRSDGGCRCFGPGEVGGYCPGPESCPLCQEPEDE